MGIKSISDHLAQLRKTVTGAFGERLWLMTEASMATIATLMLSEWKGCAALNLVDVPSSGKTTVLDFMSDIGEDIVYRTDDFTAASLVSQSAQVKNEKRLNKVDMLPRIRNKCVIIQELAPMFTAKPDDLARDMGMLTRVLDGKGLRRDGGVHGGRGHVNKPGCTWDFAWLGATTPPSRKVWQVMGNLGSRFLFLELPTRSTVADDCKAVYSSYIDTDSFTRKEERCHAAVTDYFKALRRSLGGGRFYDSMDWDNSSDCKDTLETLAGLATLIARGRTPITQDKDTPAAGFKAMSSEKPLRVGQALLAILRARSVLHDRRAVAADDLNMAVPIAFSSFPSNRRKLLELLIDPDHPEIGEVGRVKSTEVEKALKVSRPTALKMMQIMKAAGFGRLYEGAGPNAHEFVLGDDWQWLIEKNIARYLPNYDSSEDDPDVPF